jgi:hypothetical protein
VPNIVAQQAARIQYDALMLHHAIPRRASYCTCLPSTCLQHGSSHADTRCPCPQPPHLAPHTHPHPLLAGESALLQQFVDYLSDKKLAQDSEVVVLWNSKTSDLEVLLQPAVSGGVSYGQVQPGLRINSPGMCRAMFEVYLGEKAVVPEAKPAWVVGAKALLDSEQVKRDTRKPL